MMRAGVTYRWWRTVISRSRSRAPLRQVLSLIGPTLGSRGRGHGDTFASGRNIAVRFPGRLSHQCTATLVRSMRCQISIFSALICLYVATGSSAIARRCSSCRNRIDAGEVIPRAPAKDASLRVRVSSYIPRILRSWTHDAHRAGENVPELRQFVDLEPPEYCTHAGHSGIACGRDCRTCDAHSHRPELENVELPTTHAQHDVHERESVRSRTLERRSPRRTSTGLATTRPTEATIQSNVRLPAMIVVHPTLAVSPAMSAPRSTRPRRRRRGRHRSSCGCSREG